jgi:hypothetical protein
LQTGEQGRPGQGLGQVRAVRAGQLPGQGAFEDMQDAALAPTGSNLRFQGAAQGGEVLDEAAGAFPAGGKLLRRRPSQACQRPTQGPGLPRRWLALMRQPWKP